MAQVVKLRLKPQARPTRWDIYHAAARAKWIGTVEAVDAEAPIREAAKEFDVQDTKKLIAVQRPTVLS
jgi:hypothetical protein